MDLSTLRADITGPAVTNVAQLADAFDLIVANATTYNPRGHVVHEAAKAFARRAAIVVDAARGAFWQTVLLNGVRGSLRALPQDPSAARPAGVETRSTTCADLGMTVPGARVLDARGRLPLPAPIWIVPRSRADAAVARRSTSALRAAARFYRPDDNAPAGETHEARIVESCRRASCTSARPGRSRARTAPCARRARIRVRSCFATARVAPSRRTTTAPAWTRCRAGSGSALRSAEPRSQARAARRRRRRSTASPRPRPTM